MKQRIPFANFSWGQLLHAPWRALGDVWREVRWAWQRALYGYSDVDRWDLGPYLLGWLPAALREFADNCEAHPESMTMEAWTAKGRGGHARAGRHRAHALGLAAAAGIVYAAHYPPRRR